jgi:hypothetical protein
MHFFPFTLVHAINHDDAHHGFNMKSFTLKKKQISYLQCKYLKMMRLFYTVISFYILNKLKKHFIINFINKISNRLVLEK